jgi:uncharacterized RDD family membrane protein YckC
MAATAAAVRQAFQQTADEGRGRGAERAQDDREGVSFATTAYDADRPPVPASASTLDSLIGRQIDHFEIRALLGEGGMGTVYLAHDLSLDRPVAIKVLRRELGDKSDLVERLVLEAQAQARLQHPNVVNVYYIGEYAGAPYFAMEYVRGQTLADRISEHGPIPWPDALEYVIQTTRALLEANERGIVHRDVKPSNLLVCPTRGPHGTTVGLIKVADFGLAAQTGRQQEHLVGSPYYASPEQLAGKPPDHRSDIYSLGISFHELLTGTPPFEAESFGELVHLHETAPRPVIAADRAPWRLRRLITEMMDPIPAHRPWTYEELLARLQSLRPRELVAGGVAARAMALLVDAGLFAIVLALAVLGGGFSLRAGAGIAFGAWAVHYIAGHRRWGQTVGKRIFRLRIQGSTRAINVPGLLLRLLVTLWGPLLAVGVSLVGRAEGLSWQAGWGGLLAGRADSAEALLAAYGLQGLIGVLWAIGLLLPVIDPHRRALHDLLGRTRVIYAMRAEAPAGRRSA